MPERVARAIRSRVMPSDSSFDRFLPDELRLVSGRYWTPIAVALRVAEWLERAGVESVVDVGSGVGKFCVVTALATRCRFIGVEQRPRFVEAARALAEAFDVDDRVRFVHAAVSLGDIPPADAYYFYNPFGENLFGHDENLGDDVELSPERFERDVAVVETFLEQAPAGTIVVEYNGFGGRMPRCYEDIVADGDMPDMLRMWRKRPPRTGGASRLRGPARRGS